MILKIQNISVYMNISSLAPLHNSYLLFYFKYPSICCYHIVLNSLIIFRADAIKFKCLQRLQWSMPHSSTLAWKNPMDGGTWKAAVHGVAEGQTRLSNFTFTFHFHALEKETATHSSVLAWRIPATGEPGGLPSMESHRVGFDWSDLAGTPSLLIYVTMFGSAHLS